MPDLAIGLMSGTSCDGVSSALVKFQTTKFKVLASQTTAYPRVFMQRLLNSSQLSVSEVSSLNMEIGNRFAAAVLRLLKITKTSASTISVIGSHGHTIYHGPTDAHPSTLQIGEPSVISHQTGIRVVSNFRARDMAAGGEGAPLVPYFDKSFFGKGAVQVLLNLGGISNITLTGRNIKTLAMDTGPGNCLLDLTVQLLSKNRSLYDLGGRLARKGEVDKKKIRLLWQHPYFRRVPPKSTGREIFNEVLLQNIFGKLLKHSPLDVLATLTYFTAYSIAQSIKRFIHSPIQEIIVSGGGVYNKTLMDHLRDCCSPVRVVSIEKYGIPVLAKEPIAFAYLGLRALKGLPNHLPQTTGAQKTCILGSITPAAISS